MAVIGEAGCKNSHDGEVHSPNESNSRDGDTNNADFIVWRWEEFGETQRKESLSKILGVNSSQEGTFNKLSPHLN